MVPLDRCNCYAVTRDEVARKNNLPRALRYDPERRDIDRKNVDRIRTHDAHGPKNGHGLTIHW